MIAFYELTVITRLWIALLLNVRTRNMESNWDPKTTRHLTEVILSHSQFKKIEVNLTLAVRCLTSQQTKFSMLDS